MTKYLRGNVRAFIFRCQSNAVICGQAAMIGDVPIQVKSTFTDRQGTEIINQDNIDYTKAVTGVAYSKDDTKITLLGVEDKPGIAADVFEPLSKNQINVDMVIQNISTDGKKTDITYNKRQDCKNAISLIESIKKSMKKFIWMIKLLKYL